MKRQNGTGKSWKGRSEVVLEASGMEKICCMSRLMQSVSACQSQGVSGSAGPEWDRLVSEGSNYIVRANSLALVFDFGRGRVGGLWLG